MNLDLLLAPISEAAPCGDDMSFSAEFDAIQELRRADDPTLDQGEWVSALKSADWPGVVALCEKLLTQRSKDLRVAGWWTEARARLHGYAGLADGLELCTRLCEGHWDSLHPRIDEGDAEQRGGNLRWLLAQVESLAQQLPVLRHNARTLSLRDIAGALAPVRGGDAAPAPADGRLTPDDVAAARRGTPRDFLVATLADAQRAQQALAALQVVIDARMGAEGPGFAAARQALEEAAHAVDRLTRDGKPAAGAATAAGGAMAATAGADTRAGASASSSAAQLGEPAVGGPLRSRAEALQQLRAVADFFRQTEPHSPVAYLAERAAQWGDMPLHDWLRAVVKDPAVLSGMEELLGVPPAAAKE
jgi:type VI secretion system protein ImpA